MVKKDVFKIFRMILASVLLIGIIFYLFAPDEVEEGTYKCTEKPGLMLDLSGGDYDLWMEKGTDIVELQLGKYEVEDDSIVFRPDISDVGDMIPLWTIRMLKRSFSI